MPETTKHLSGRLHVTGASRFIGEEFIPQGCLHLAVVYSTCAHGSLDDIDASQALALPGVHAVLTAADIPGRNNIAHGNNDTQPLLAEGTVTYHGQPIALVAAETAELAIEAASRVKATYTPREALLTIDAAMAAQSWYTPPRHIERGDVEQAFAAAECIVEGEVETGAQEHFYLETQRTLALYDDDGGITLYAATQSTSEVQTVAARVTARSSHKITVDVKRLGGAFGGKESQATLWSSLAALAASVLRTSCYLQLRRINDMAATGKRHPFKNHYRLACSADGRILGYDVTLCCNGGAYIDLSMAILERAMFHSDHAYFLPNARIIGYACRTNLPPNTAFRGFGAPQGIYTLEYAIQRAAHKLCIPPMQMRMLNCYTTGQTTPFGMEVADPVGRDMLRKLQELSNWDALQQKVAQFNSSHRYRKQGIGIMPGKFGISFTTAFLNQGSALVWIYADGTLSLSHGGVEMGQSVNAKVAAVVAHTLGISLSRIRVESANTKRVGNASPTAASTGSDINGHAARNAALKLKRRLADMAVQYFAEHHIVCQAQELSFADDAITTAQGEAIAFADLVRYAYLHTCDLGAHGYYFTPGLHYDKERGKGKPFHYYVFGGAAVVSEVDLLTGEYQLRKIYVVHDNARSLNPDIDLGQIYGAFVQGYGYCTMEDEPFSSDGRYLALTPSTYKFPTICDIPDIFEVELVDLMRTHASVLGSKAVGEPPFIYGLAGWFALYDALRRSLPSVQDISLAFPATPQAVLLAYHNAKKENPCS
jgi:xanthine dehydrogenase large subunit